MSDNPEKGKEPVYHVTYKVTSHPEGIKREDLPEDESACDALVLLPIAFPPNGSFSMMLRTRDGRGEPGPMKADDIWKAWVTMGTFIKDDPKLSPAQRLLAGKVYDAITAVKAKAKA